MELNQARQEHNKAKLELASSKGGELTIDKHLNQILGATWVPDLSGLKYCFYAACSPAHFTSHSAPDETAGRTVFLFAERSEELEVQLAESREQKTAAKTAYAEKESMCRQLRQKLEAAQAASGAEHAELQACSRALLCIAASVADR